ncbi:DUF4383 domain-containing protein [Mangrovihabitans endophyticus]|uniref:DUF4383 domain-containing protein n=1 Tax=Mangrovihabitans endophyticus TaxID=1751298 RepID=A0A8J3FNR9_9ACTN|nr:DUF4383 domain-containing protein [Mangrovihabitans endophyticus]GGK83857.1 hypothetical protein GCM10012284_17500 [Mangrovihabitans endophyticus]
MAHYPLNHSLRQTYRFIAALGGLYLVLTGAIGIAQTWGDAFFGDTSDWVLGVRVNPAGAWFFLIAGLVVLGAATVGGNMLHQVNLILGWALLAVSMIELAVMQTDANVLNVSMVNVFALIVVGLLTLTAGLYGRVDEVGPERRTRTNRTSTPVN